MSSSPAGSFDWMIDGLVERAATKGLSEEATLSLLIQRLLSRTESSQRVVMEDGETFGDLIDKIVAVAPRCRNGVVVILADEILDRLVEFEDKAEKFRGTAK